MATQEQQYLRFSLMQRLEHWLMSLSFTMLVITGLPQRYALAAWAEFMIERMGGIETVRVIHRWSAIVFMVVMIYHFIAVAYKIIVLRTRLTMLPTLADGKDIVNSLRYYLGLTADHPKLPRYNFAEKMEYWAVVWGGVLMTVTGFILWNPIATTRLFPGQVVPAALAAHSAEALLAFLAIIIWHLYWVHIKTFNRAMFTGRLTRAQMALEHQAELEEIEAGQRPQRPSPILVRRRERIFMPLVAVITVVTLISLYSFVTFEQTAITTVPRAEAAEAFVRATPRPTRTPLPTPSPTPTPVGGERLADIVSMISHPLPGREDCFECHAADGPIPNPVDHIDYTLEMCEVCHAVDHDKVGPSPIKHKLVERERCNECHEIDLQPLSHQVADFSNRTCFVCHTPLFP